MILINQWQQIDDTSLLMKMTKKKKKKKTNNNHVANSMSCPRKSQLQQIINHRKTSESDSLLETSLSSVNCEDAIRVGQQMQTNLDG